MATTTAERAAAVTAQLEEFGHAKQALSDLQLAHKLQLEEALRASLRSNSGGSSSTERDIIDLCCSDDEDLPEAEEAARAELELQDSLLAQALAREEQIMTAQQLHDANFAGYLQNMPTRAWEQGGDLLQDTFCAARARSPHLTLHCSGVARGNPSGPAGCAAVLLNPAGDVLWQGSQSLGITSAAAAQLAGVALGLGAALDLGAAKMQLKGDSREVVNQVREVSKSRKGGPHTHAPSAGQVGPLEGLISCLEDLTTEVVAPDNSSLVHRLALAASRAAPNQAVARALGSGNGTRAAEAALANAAGPSGSGSHATESCGICLEDVPKPYLMALGGCPDHRFCASCLTSHVAIKIKERSFPLYCPSQGCQVQAKMADLRALQADDAMADAFNKLSVEASIPAEQRFYCPFPNCSALMQLDRMGPDSPVRCYSCSKDLCPFCRVGWHKGFTCQRYQALPMDQRSAEDQALLKLAGRKRWRQCPKCNVMVELAMGCNHIFCLCGHEFCYLCGTAWTGRALNRSAACGCDLFDPEGRQLLENPAEGEAAVPEPREVANPYRTRLCRYWQQGHCRHGPECRFAHGEHQLRRWGHDDDEYDF